MYKDLDEHIKSIHSISKSQYGQMQSGEIPKYESNNSINKKSGGGSLNFNNMTSSEQIAYAIAISAEEEERKKNNNNKNIKGAPK